MPITTHPFNIADIPQLQHALARWIHQAGDCGYCHIGELPHHLYDASPNALPVAERILIWEDNTDIIGFAITLLFDSSFEIYIAPAYRGTETERTLLKAAINRNRELIQHNQRHNLEANIDVWGCDSIRAQHLTELDFGKYRAWTLINERPLQGRVPLPTLPDGFTIRAATHDDYVQLVAVRNAGFNITLDAELYRERVLEMPAFIPEHDIIAIAPNGQIAAFTHIWLDEINKVGLFEPVGTHPGYRRSGLARCIMCAGLNIMHDNNMTTARVGHTITNAAAYHLYQKLGFRSKHITYGFKESSHKTAEIRYNVAMETRP